MIKSHLKIIIAFGLPLIAVAIFTFPRFSKTQIKGTSNIEEIAPPSDAEETASSSGAWCNNSDEASDFDEQISIVWTAKMDGCLESCQGASFTKEPADDKYPRFAGYYPDTEGNYFTDNFNPIPDKFQQIFIYINQVRNLWWPRSKRILLL